MMWSHVSDLQRIGDVVVETLYERALSQCVCVRGQSFNIPENRNRVNSMNATVPSFTAKCSLPKLISLLE